MQLATSKNKRGASTSLTDVLTRLHSIKFGKPADRYQERMSVKAIGEFFETLALLIENGLSLQKAIASVANDGVLKKHREMIYDICRRVDSGESFSVALGMYSRAFSPTVVKQLRIAERSGTVVDALRRLATQLRRKKELHSRIVKKLSYPALVVFAGTGLIFFMMIVVVPQFEEMYAESKVELPLITQFVSSTSRMLFRYGWIGIGCLVLSVIAFVRLRRSAKSGLKVDQFLIRLPYVGSWLRDIAVLQFFDAINTMIESGFVPVDAISESVDSVNNRAVKKAAYRIKDAVVRGDKLSDELARHKSVFPQTVNQLIVVGEQTGSLQRATLSVRDHLAQRIENRVNAMVSALEPTLTISLAIAIGVVVLAIYMPMFSMFEVLE